MKAQKIINQPSGRDYAPDVITYTPESSYELRLHLGMPVISIKNDKFDLNFFSLQLNTLANTHHSNDYI